MKRLSCFLAIVLLATTALVLSTTVATAQNPSYPPAGNQYRPTARPAAGNIAVLDMGRVFDNHARLKSMRKTMEAKMQGLEADFKKEGEIIRKMSEDLREYKIGTQDYVNLDSAITKRKAQLQADLQLRRKEIMLNQAEMLHSVYTEIEREVAAIAQARGLLMVVKEMKVESDPSDPRTVEQNVGKQLIWYSQSIDITDELIARVNRGASYGTANRPTNTNPQRPMR